VDLSGQQLLDVLLSGKVLSILIKLSYSYYKQNLLGLENGRQRHF
jgi:hypothetical protein